MSKVIKFEKNDCVPCDQVSAFLDEKGVAYERINPFDNPELAVKYKVRTVPTVLVIENDEVQQRIIGFNPDELQTLA